MRSIVAKMGYKLSEKGLFDRVSGKKIDFFPKDEKDIFDYLKLDYVKPEDRL
jgi:DNA polymerase/3'-5' exonuclease PolX